MFIQTFYQYPVTFSSIGKTIPAHAAQEENLVLTEVTDRELSKLRNSEPFFRELESKKKIRVLNHMPDRYKSSASRINEAQDEIARLKAENEKLRSQSAEEKAEESEETTDTSAGTSAPAAKKTSSKKGKK